MVSPEEIREAEQELEEKMAYIIKKWTTASCK